MARAFSNFSCVVGGLPVELSVESGLGFWPSVESQFAPFISPAAGPPVLRLSVGRGEAPATPGRRALSCSQGIAFDAYDSGGGWRWIRICGPADECWLRFKPGCPDMRLAITKGEPLAEAVTAMAHAYAVAAAGAGALLAHAACVELGGEAYIFIGENGAGKSTHARLWTGCLGARLVNDDAPVVAFEDGRPVAHGSPWSGKGQCYRNVQYPLRGIARIIKDSSNRMERLDTDASKLRAFASLVSSFAATAWISELSDITSQSIARLAHTVPIFNLHCAPDPEAAAVALNAFASCGRPR